MPPPVPDGRHREFRSVVVDSNAHPALVGRKIINPIGCHLAEFLVLEIVNVDLGRATLQMPLPPLVLNASDQFLLLGVDTDDGLLVPLVLPHLAIKMPELFVTVRMVLALFGLAHRLETVTLLPQHRGHRAGADRMPADCELSGECGCALAGPPQRSHGVTEGCRINESVKGAASPESLWAKVLRPPPGCLLRPAASSSNRSGSSKEAIPAWIVPRLRPVARATMLMPPCPSDRASIAAHLRRPAAFKLIFISSYFLPISTSMFNMLDY